MVAFRRKDFENVMFWAVKKAASCRLRQNNFLEEPVVLARCPVPRIPKKCWVLKVAGQLSFVSGKIGVHEVLLVFSSEIKAIQFLKNIGRDLNEYRIIPLGWIEMARNFEDDYDYVVIDELGLSKIVDMVPINILPPK